MPLAVDLAALTPPPHALFSLASPAVAGARGSSRTKSVTVRPGDTVWDLAIHYHTTPKALVAKNRLRGGGRLLVVGQRLLVPIRSTSGGHVRASVKVAKARATAAKRRTAAASTSTRTHVVRAGETMSGLAVRYHLSLTKLLAANRLRSAGLIFVGQKIVVPRSGSKAVAPKPRATVKVVKKTSTAVERSRRTLEARSAPSRTETAALIRSTAGRHGVDPRLALAIGWLESGWYQRAVSHTDAVGVMQIMPISGTWASQLAGKRLDRYDTRDNITSGVLMLRALQRSADSREQAIAAYYQGLSSVRSRGLYTDTKKYVASVLAIYARM